MRMAYIKLYHDWLDTLEPLNDEERGRLFTALLEYFRTGEVPVLEGNERFIFPTLRAQLDRDAAAYEKLCEQNASNARTGVHKRAQADAGAGSQDKEKDEEEDKDKDEDKEKNKDYSSRRASGPRAAGRKPAAGREKKFSRGKKAAEADYAEARRDIDRMQRFLRQLRQTEMESDPPPTPSTQMFGCATPRQEAG